MNSPRVVIVIPAYNEERFIGSVLLKLRHYPAIIIVVDDGSSDDTARIAQDAGALVIRHPCNRGKGAALATGLHLARLAASDAQFALRLLRLRPYDLFFAYFSTLDAISHFFWPSDSSPNEPSPGSPLFNAYRLYDRILASFLDALDPATPFILLSDHGHGPRPLRLFNVNELLRRNGFLTTRPLARSPHRHLLDRSRRFALRLVNRFALARPAAMLMRRLPCLLQPFTRPAVIDWDRTLACATDLSGIKAYSYGGIRLNPTLLPSHRNDETRSEIIRLLQRDCRLPDGTSLIQFALPREELLQGPYLDLYPDILIQLVDGYGLGWGVNLPLFTLADAHNIVPGSHRADTGVFVYRGDRLLRPDLTSVDLLDITPSILDLFGVPPAFPYDGRSIFSPLSPDSSS